MSHPCGQCDWCRFTLRLLGLAYLSLCLRPVKGGQA